MKKFKRTITLEYVEFVKIDFRLPSLEGRMKSTEIVKAKHKAESLENYKEIDQDALEKIAKEGIRKFFGVDRLEQAVYQISLAPNEDNHPDEAVIADIDVSFQDHAKLVNDRFVQSEIDVFIFQKELPEHAKLEIYGYPSLFPLTYSH